MASSSIVIKVKFGETLRRFNALVLDKVLALDVAALRDKVRILFSFAPEVDFTLTYVDEDGDVVTLADDDDLHDVVKQSLNPLRITVTLKSDKSGGSSGSSTPHPSPQEQAPYQAPNSGVSEILKAVPEPIREVLSKLPLDHPGVSEVLKSVPEPLQDAISRLSLGLSSKATVSAPGFAEFFENDMKTYPWNMLSDSKVGSKVCSPVGSQENNMSAPNIKDTQGSKIGTFGKLPSINSKSLTKEGKAPMDNEAGSSNSKNKVTEGVKVQGLHPPRHVDPSLYFGLKTFQPQGNAKGVIGSGKQSYSPVVTVGVEKKDDSGVEKLSEADKKKDVAGESLNGNQTKAVGFGAPTTTSKATEDSCNASWFDQGMNGTKYCPYVGMLPSDTNCRGYQHVCAPRFKRSHHGSGMASIFHLGVCCDGCGVHPITGPRFKSKVKADYDLCGVCFVGMGNDADYIRIDRPVSHRHPLSYKGYRDLFHPMRTPLLPHQMLRNHGMKHSRSKLDSRFILDVNILDGTIMAPSTNFTKIWRMRNNGSSIWPQGTELLWIGGEKLSNTVAVEVEIPAEGLSVNKELDVAVDFTAPELPGRYISYWRMSSPSGQKFGQRIWVLIEVDASMKDLGERAINLNLIPDSSGMNSEAVDMKASPVALMGRLISDKSIVKAMESGDPFLDALPNKDQETNFPINDNLIIDNGGVSSTLAASGAFESSPKSPVGVSVSSDSSVFYPTVEAEAANLDSVFYPTVDFPEAQPTAPLVAHGPSAVVQSSASDVGEASDGNLGLEQALLRELEQMGFKQPDLNKEILKKNEYDLEQTIDDLCGVYEWDPILEELQEMGFADNEANKRLLKKNNGSIKRVVMDLINGEKA